MTDWSKKISSIEIVKRPEENYEGIVIGFWGGSVSSGSIEDAKELHGWPIVAEPFNKHILFKEINRLEAKVEEMQKTLEWYADEENYKRSENDHQTGYPHEIMWDKGIKARSVLKHLGLTVEGIEE